MEPRLIFDPSEASAKQSSAHLAKYHKIFSFAQPGRTAVWGREGGVCFPKICDFAKVNIRTRHFILHIAIPRRLYPFRQHVSF